MGKGKDTLSLGGRPMVDGSEKYQQLPLMLTAKESAVPGTSIFWQLPRLASRGIDVRPSWAQLVKGDSYTTCPGCHRSFHASDHL